MSFLSMLDRLFLAEDEQLILDYVTRHPRSTLGQIANATKLAIDEVKKQLEQFIAAKQVIEDVVDEMRVYSINLGLSATSIRNVSDELNIFRK